MVGASVMTSVLILNSGRAGNVNRCLGLAEALGVKDPDIFTLKSKWTTHLFDWLPVPWVFSRLPQAPFDYQIVIAAGARESRVLRWMKKQNPKLMAVQIMRPAGGWNDFNAVIVEAHDNPPKRKNVCITTGAVNRVTKEKLAAESQRWAKRLQHCKKPCLAVMVGGASRHAPFGKAEATALARDVLAAAKTGGYSLLISTSRRTGEHITDMLRTMFEKQRDVPVHFWQPDDITTRDNPYFAYLDMANAVVVTGDSISMVSEACTAGKPVYVWGAESHFPRKFKTFFTTLAEQGRVRLWPKDGKLTLRPPAAGLMDTLIAAGFVRAKMRG